ncbi:RNA 3'-terminal phosphate cyclase-like protein [Bacillus rossius redtenbacheri]|uniref:RNA 3'-terminal phosphate cyclase-like protein n=1 Tax=Bacillus rossius redtenbacheri TaxID=93214 RepID=UPI002FDE9EB1
MNVNMASTEKHVVEYEGSNFLRQRLVLSTVSGKPVRISNIRSLDDDPGLKEYEVNLIRLLDKITNGTRIQVNQTGTTLYYQPGLLQGGILEHTCCKLKSICYYLEVLLVLGPFFKNPLNITLKGVTNSQVDPSVDSFIGGAIAVLKRFIVVDDGLELKVKKRGMAPEGGGEVVFKCPARRTLRPVQFVDSGKVKRIRGTVYAVRVSPAIANRIVSSAKEVLLQCLPDVYIHTDHNRGPKSGKSPGFGVCLVAETTNGVFYTAEAVSNPSGSAEVSVPEDIGKLAAFNLMEEIYRGGCVDSTFQSIAAMLMTLSPKDVSKIVVGPLSPYTIQCLRHIRDFFGLTFKLEPFKTSDEEEEELKLGGVKIIMSCIGIGYINYSKRTM